MNKYPSLICLSAVLILTGCSGLERGHPPAEYAGALKRMEGAYEGPVYLSTLDGTVSRPVTDRGHIQILVNEDGSLKIEPQSDWLDSGCGLISKEMRHFRVISRDPFEFEAILKFSADGCPDHLPYKEIVITGKSPPLAAPTVTVRLTKSLTADGSKRARERPLNYTGSFQKQLLRIVRVQNDE